MPNVEVQSVSVAKPELNATKRESTPVEHAPKTAFVAEVVAANSRTAEFNVEFASNKPGEMNQVAATLEKHKVNILSGFHDAARWSFFADLSQSDVSTADLAQELKTLPHVMKVRTQEGVNGVIVDGLHHPLTWGKNRAIMFRLDTIVSMFSRPREMFGTEGPVAKVILHEMGRVAGQSSIRTIAETIGEGRIREQLHNIMNVYAASGWGIFRLMNVDFSRGVGVVQAFDNFECAGHRGEGKKPYSQFVRGHLAGLFSGVFDRRVSAVETHCITQGVGFCQFEIASEDLRQI
jgi:predicted hydrocarbon binding protein